MAAMQKRRPEEIVGEWGARDVTPPSARERKQLEADRELNPLTGKPLRRRLRNFRAEADNYLASLGGSLSYMQRPPRVGRAAALHAAPARDRARDGPTPGAPGRAARRGRRRRRSLAPALGAMGLRRD